MMSKTIHFAPLGDAMKIAIDAVPVDPSASYKISGVYSFGRGLFGREPLAGSQTTYKVFHRLHENDFVLSQVKGWEGALARVTKQFDGWFLSPQFPTFRADTEKLDIRYVEWYCRQNLVWEQLRKKSRGMGARRETVSPTDFLSLQIPLPPLDEQRRIVARIEALAECIAEARGLRQEMYDEQAQLLVQKYHELIDGAKRMPMNEVAPIIRRSIEMNPETKYFELGIRSFGKGTFHKPPLTGLELGTKRVFQIEPGDLLFSNVFAWEGAIAVAQKYDQGRIGSHRFISCLAKPGIATSNFLCFHFLTKQGLLDIGQASPGGAGRNRTLGLEKLEKLIVPIPAYDKQLWFDNLNARVEALKRLQAETQAELDALLPSVLDKAFKGEL